MLMGGHGVIGRHTTPRLAAPERLILRPMYH
jgi:hypothetical protein